MNNNTSKDDLTAEPKHDRKLEIVTVLVCVAFSIIIHGSFVIRGFGEHDAAHLAVQAADLHETGKISNPAYTVNTSPLYIHALKLVLDMGFAMDKIPSLMNWTNVIIGSLTLIPLYLLWRSLSNPFAAATGCLMYSFVPAFWLGNIYGMPHLPAFGCLSVAAVFFATALKSSGQKSVVMTALTIVFASIAVNLKADIILGFGVFFGIAICLKSLNLRNIALMILIAAVALLTAMAHSRMIIPLEPQAGQWTRSFPFTLRAILNPENAVVPVTATGICLFLATIVCIIYCLVRRVHLRILSMSLCWAMPGMLFWSLKTGNSARHLMAPYCALIFFTAVIIVSEIKSGRGALALIAALLVVNYFASPGFLLSRTVRPSSRIFKAKHMIQERIDDWHKKGISFAALPDGKKIVLGDATKTYAVWEVLAQAKSFQILSDRPITYRLINDDDSVQLVRIHSGKRPVTAELKQGWRIWSWQQGTTISDPNPL